MARNGTYIVEFAGSEVSWERFDGNSLSAAEPPAPGVRASVVALVPDSYFYFYLPRNVPPGGGRNARAAANLQLQHLFPPVADGQVSGLMRTPAGELLAYFSHPSFEAFREEHEEVFQRASVVTTPFLLAHCAAEAQGMTVWRSGGNGSPRALRSGEDLYYFTGGEVEVEARIKALELDEEPPLLGVEQALAELERHQVKLSKSRLPLAGEVAEGEVDVRLWKRALVLIGLVGLFFCVGEAFRMHSLSIRADAWKQAVDEQFARALGTNLGADPLGKLLFTLDQLKGTGTTGIDVRGMLEFISRAAPESFRIESFSLNSDSGSIRARIGSYDALEKMLDALSGDARFAFTLEQATNQDEGVSLNLKVDFGR